MKREELIEKMARAICEACGQSVEKFWRDWINEATAALTAIEAAGMGYNTGLEDAAKAANALPSEYSHDGASMHVENITCARCATAIRAMKTK